MTLWGLILLTVFTAFFGGVWVGLKIALLSRNGVGDADEYRAGGTD